MPARLTYDSGPLALSLVDGTSTVSFYHFGTDESNNGRAKQLRLNASGRVCRARPSLVGRVSLQTMRQKVCRQISSSPPPTRCGIRRRLSSAHALTTQSRSSVENFKTSDERSPRVKVTSEWRTEKHNEKTLEIRPGKYAIKTKKRTEYLEYRRIVCYGILDRSPVNYARLSKRLCCYSHTPSSSL